jgi:hypothetical protein
MRMTLFMKSLDQLTEFPKKLYTRPALKKIFLEHSGVPDWLLARCQKEGGDLAETLARCWPEEGPGLELDVTRFIAEDFPGLLDGEKLIETWNQCKTSERIWVNRLLLGYVPPAPIPVPDPSLPRKEIQAELMYALMSGEPEYSFGLKKGQDLLVFARFEVSDTKLSIQLQQFIGKNTLIKKGPVREVARGLVGKISYTDLSPSSRHKSGFKVEGAQLESLFPPGGLWQADTLHATLSHEGKYRASDTPIPLSR